VIIVILSAGYFVTACDYCEMSAGYFVTACDYCEMSAGYFVTACDYYEMSAGYFVTVCDYCEMSAGYFVTACDYCEMSAGYFVTVCDYFLLTCLLACESPHLGSAACAMMRPRDAHVRCLYVWRSCFVHVHRYQTNSVGKGLGEGYCYALANEMDALGINCFHGKMVNAGEDWKEEWFGRLPEAQVRYCALSALTRLKESGCGGGTDM
jgi:hypothetical protein